MATRPVTRLASVATFSALPSKIKNPGINEGTLCWVIDVKADYSYIANIWTAVTPLFSEITLSGKATGIIADFTVKCGYQQSGKLVTLHIPSYYDTPIAGIINSNAITLSLNTAPPPKYDFEDLIVTRNNILITTVPTIAVITIAANSNTIGIFSNVNRNNFTTVVTPILNSKTGFNPKTISYITA